MIFHLTLQNGSFKEARSGEDFPRRIDDGADPGIGRPDEVETVFDRPENRHGEMLIRRRCFSEPGIVGDVHEQIGLLPFVIPCRFRKDPFITDQDTETVSVAVRGLNPFPGRKSPTPATSLPMKGKIRLRGTYSP